MRGLWPFLKAAWGLALPYFRSEERWSARLLLGAIIVMNLTLVGLNVVLNYWNGAFFDSLQNKDSASFINLLFLWRWNADGFMPGFALIAAIFIPVAIYRTYLNQWLQIRWRRWLTARMLDDWLDGRAYYRLSLGGVSASAATADDPLSRAGIDNPDQRIADDLRDFVSDTLSLGLGLLSNVVTLVNFTLILWTLSGAVTLLGITIPGYMVWVALGYSILGTWLTHLVGRPLIGLNFNQQRYEADFRFALVRLRENAEGIALHAGETEEKRMLMARFGAVMVNWWAIMRRQKLLGALNSGYSQVASIFPIVVAAPRYFAGQIALGGLTRTSSAFGQVQGALSWFVDAYSSLASWRATVERLVLFTHAIQAAHAARGLRTVPGGPDLVLRDTKLELPGGTLLLDAGRITLPAGQRTVITGRSGSGKSTLFRALAGIWPFGSGTLEQPPGPALFLPQRPYIPLGTLRHAVAYPADPSRYTDGQVKEALGRAGLEWLTDRLDDDQPWASRLSGGEQQRLAFARAFLLRPDWLFLDEATASLDPQGELELYTTLKTVLPATSVVSIAHRTAVADLHDNRLVFSRDGNGPAEVLPAG